MNFGEKIKTYEFASMISLVFCHVALKNNEKFDANSYFLIFSPKFILAEKSIITFTVRFLSSSYLLMYKFSVLPYIFQSIVLKSSPKIYLVGVRIQLKLS